MTSLIKSIVWFHQFQTFHPTRLASLVLSHVWFQYSQNTQKVYQVTQSKRKVMVTFQLYTHAQLHSFRLQANKPKFIELRNDSELKPTIEVGREIVHPGLYQVEVCLGSLNNGAVKNRQQEAWLPCLLEVGGFRLIRRLEFKAGLNRRLPRQSAILSARLERIVELRFAGIRFDPAVCQLLPQALQYLKTITKLEVSHSEFYGCIGSFVKHLFGLQEFILAGWCRSQPKDLARLFSAENQVTAGRKQKGVINLGGDNRTGKLPLDVMKVIASVVAKRNGFQVLFSEVADAYGGKEFLKTSLKYMEY